MLKKDTYTILEGGEHLIGSLTRMNIIMDKFKTSQMGAALKKVYRGQLTVEASLNIVRDEIRSVFSESETNRAAFDGFVGDAVGKCPLCGAEVRRTKFGYGCSAYRDGCKFASGNIICGRVISCDDMSRLLTQGETPLLEGFVSKKSGKTFSARLALDGGKVMFRF